VSGDLEPAMRVRRHGKFLISAIGGLWILTATGAADTRVIVPKIMPLGDSITEGDSRRDSYRWYLWRFLRDAGFRVDFVGSQQPHAHGPPIPPDDDFDTDYEGHTGWSSLDLLKGVGIASQGKLETWLLANSPDIVLLHIGTNDVFRCFPLTQSAGAIRRIVEVIHNHNPSTVVLIAKLIPAGHAATSTEDSFCGDGRTMNERINELNSLIEGVPLDGCPAFVVDMHSALDPLVDLRDRLHPNESGQRKMARVWFEALRPLLRTRWQEQGPAGAP
jgi:acyl-CoA thioesterase I